VRRTSEWRRRRDEERGTCEKSSDGMEGCEGELEGSLEGVGSWRDAQSCLPMALEKLDGARQESKVEEGGQRGDDKEERSRMQAASSEAQQYRRWRKCTIVDVGTETDASDESRRERFPSLFSTFSPSQKATEQTLSTLLVYPCYLLSHLPLL
jgi:hypothetical protein